MSLKDAMIIDYRDKNPKKYFAKEGLIKKRYIALLDVNEINIDSSNMLNYDSKNIEINFIQEDILNSLKCLNASGKHIQIKKLFTCYQSISNNEDFVNR